MVWATPAVVAQLSSAAANNPDLVGDGSILAVCSTASARHAAKTQGENMILQMALWASSNTVTSIQDRKATNRRTMGF
jgi:hypothetical protein